MISHPVIFSNELDKNRGHDLVFQTRKKRFNCRNRIYIMGILNATPDSFSDGSLFNTYDKGIRRIDEMIRDKADIIDIGGESSRPGARRITVREELGRILPFLRYIRKNHKVLVSIDTYKSQVALEALKNGADIINDITGLQRDRHMARTIGRYKAGVVMMHIKGTPATMQVRPVYQDLMKEINDYLEKSIKIALENGIDFNNIIIDPGIGFGKTVEDNYLILNKLEELKTLGRPILIGVSRKSLIGRVLGNQPRERLTGSICLNTAGALGGASFLRVHDVREHREVKTLLEFLFKKGVT